MVRTTHHQPRANKPNPKPRKAQYGKSLSTRILAWRVVRLRVCCGGDQRNVIAVNNEVDDTVNCRSVTQRSSRCGRRVRRNVFFKFCPLLALLLSTRRRRLARRQSTAAVFHGIRSSFLRRSMHPLPVDCLGGRAVTVAHHVSIFASFCLDF